MVCFVIYSVDFFVNMLNFIIVKLMRRKGVVKVVLKVKEKVIVKIVIKAEISEKGDEEKRNFGKVEVQLEKEIVLRCIEGFLNKRVILIFLKGDLEGVEVKEVMIVDFIRNEKIVGVDLCTIG